MTIKGIITKPSNYLPSVMYTVPAGKKALVRNLVACTELLNNYFINRVTVKLGTGEIIAADTSVVMGGKTPSIIAEPFELTEGESISASVAIQWASKIIEGQRLPANIEALNISDNGAVWVASCGKGIGLFRSADQGQTWTFVSNTVSNVAAFVYFKNTFFFYMTDGTTLKSVDQGLNFTTHTYLDTPTKTTLAVNLHGRILKKDANTIVAVYNTGYRLCASSDGVTWGMIGNDLPNAPSTRILGLGWTGSYYVACTNTASHGVLYSSDANTWNSGSLSGSGSIVDLLGYNSNGAVVVSSASIIKVSLDHGVNFTTKYNIGPITNMFVWTGSYFYGGWTSGIVSYINPLKCDYGTTSGGHEMKPSCAFVAADKIIGVQNNMVWQTYNLDPLNEQRYGMALHLSINEEPA